MVWSNLEADLGGIKQNLTHTNDKCLSLLSCGSVRMQPVLAKGAWVLASEEHIAANPAK